MGWEVRGNRRFYYTSITSGGRSTKRYLGRGEAAELAAAAVEQRKAERTQQAGQACQERERHAATEGPLAELCDKADALLAAALTAAGYHRPARGPWRRKRCQF
jgi:hypothetical protein